MIHLTGKFNLSEMKELTIAQTELIKTFEDILDMIDCNHSKFDDSFIWFIDFYKVFDKINH